MLYFFYITDLRSAIAQTRVCPNVQDFSGSTQCRAPKMHEMTEKNS
jgi:hypothetical protein